MITVYKEVEGRVEKRVVAEGARIHLRGDLPPIRHMSEHILKVSYDLECQGKFRSAYPKSVIKKVHETALERWKTTGEEV